MVVKRVNPRTNTRSKRKSNIPGRKSRAELMGVEKVEVVQKTNGKMLASVMRRLRDDIQDAMKDNDKTEVEIMRTIGVKRYEK